MRAPCSSAPDAPEAFGDYLAGPNHVLPTGGTARFASPLGVYDFVKRTSLIEAGPRTLARLGPVAARLARLEGLEAHARSVERRLKDRNGPGARSAPPSHGKITSMTLRARRAPARHKGRAGTVARKTRETEIRLDLALDGEGRTAVKTGVPFLDHMLELFGKHGFFDLTVQARGDVEVDDHHTVEDVGLVLGQALREAMGDKAGIRRFGEATVPLDEALVQTVVDLSGRPFLVYDVKIKQARIGTFDVELIHDFLLALVNQAGMNLHVRMLSGRNPHHIIEATFKGLARALDQATQRDPRVRGVPSTKGTLDG